MKFDDIRKSSRGNLIIACDFDDTLFTHPNKAGRSFPQVGEPIWKTINFVLEKQRLGAKVIMWTCRQGSEVANAVLACKKVGLEFDAVNDTIPENDFTESRKIYATIYIDDRAVNPADL